MRRKEIVVGDIAIAVGGKKHSLWERASGGQRCRRWASGREMRPAEVGGQKKINIKCATRTSAKTVHMSSFVVSNSHSKSSASSDSVHSVR